MKIISEKNSKILIAIGIFLLVFGLFFFVCKIYIDETTSLDTSKFSEFGDYFGGVVGAIWSLAGVFLFYLALEEQRKDIKINQEALKKQIEEFELQRNELEETRKVFKEQSETLKIQRFENTFFQLINLYNEIIGNLQFRDNGKTYDKRDIFRIGKEKLYNTYTHYLKIYMRDEYGDIYEKKEITPQKVEDISVYVKDEYHDFYFKHTNQVLSNYFRTVYHVLKFIYKSNLIDENRKKFYSSILRAQLSNDELFLIFYNSIYEGLGYPKLLFLIQKFDILQNFDFNLISEFTFHKELYERKLDELQNFEL